MSSFFSFARRARLTGTVPMLGLALAFCLAASPATAQEALSVDLSARAGISTNPFLLPGSTPTAGSVTLGVRPSWVSERPRTTLRVDGSVEASFYNQGYGTNESVTVQGSGVHRLSERTTLTAGVGYINTIVGSFGGLYGGGYTGIGGFGGGFGGGFAPPVTGGVTTPGTTPVTDTTPITGAPPVTGGVPVTGGLGTGGLGAGFAPGLPYITDPALGGIGQRRQIYLASGGLTTALSARDQLSLGVAASANRSGQAFFDDFNYATPSVTYTHVLGENFSVGAIFSVGFIDYLGTSLGDATIYQPALTATRGLGNGWTLTGTLGLAIVDLKDAPGQGGTSTSVNGSADLCRKDQRWWACFGAARQTVPSSFLGVRTQTSAYASGGYRISPRDEVGFSASYSHASNPIRRDLLDDRINGSVDFASLLASYSRRLATRLWGNATIGYAQAFDDGVDRDANLTALVGVTYRLGRP